MFLMNIIFSAYGSGFSLDNPGKAQLKISCFIGTSPANSEGLNSVSEIDVVVKSTERL